MENQGNYRTAEKTRAYRTERKAAANRKRRKRLRRRRRFLAAAAVILIGCLLWNGTENRSPGYSDNTGGEAVASQAMSGTQISRLEALVPEYPELSDVLENSSEYPAEAVDMFLKNRETAGYLLNYPSESGKKHSDDISEELGENGIPLFLQWDERWGYDSYGDGKIGWTGCGPTCLAMASAGLTGRKKWTPASVAEFSEKRGYYTYGSGTSWELMTSGAEAMGLHSEEIPLSEGSMKDKLDDGSVIICSVGPGDFTTEGHFILLRGYTEGGFLVNDPNSRERSEKVWPYQRLSGQIRNLWAISA